MKDAPRWALVGCLLLAGCPRAEEPAPSPRVQPNGVPAPERNDEPPPPTWVGEMTLEVGDWERVEELLAKHRGKVVVVHLWATWCEPCVREFAELVALQRRYGDRIAAVSVNADYAGLEEQPPESFVDEVRQFLEAGEAQFDNVISSVPDEQLYARLEVAYHSVLVYDREGTLQETITQEDEQYEDGFSYRAHVEPVVRRLLEAQPPAGSK